MDKKTGCALVSIDDLHEFKFSIFGAHIKHAGLICRALIAEVDSARTIAGAVCSRGRQLNVHIVDPRQSDRARPFVGTTIQWHRAIRIGLIFGANSTIACNHRERVVVASIAIASSTYLDS